MTCHNKLRGGVSNLTRKAFTPLYVYYNHLIHTDRAIWGAKAHSDGPQQPENSPLVPYDS